MHPARNITVALALVGLQVASAQTAAPPIVYPEKGQSADQQQKDSGECAAWAKQTTGIDPVAVASAPAAPAAAPPAAAAEPKGERLRGAARGAAAGAVVGEIADDNAGDGAAYGAAAGVVAGGRKARKNEAQAKQQATQAQAQATADAEAAKQEKLATYNRANAACMEGRGYVVK